MTSEEIIERYEAAPPEPRLFADPDWVLRNTPFKSFEREYNQKVIVHWWSNALWANFNSIREYGYNPETNQTTISWSISKDANLSKLPPP